MPGPVDVTATNAFVHLVMNRCADAEFAADITLDGIDAPAGVELTTRGDPETGRLLDASITFEPPLSATDVVALFERVATQPDDSVRVLLRAPADHGWSRFGPTRVTLAFPSRPTVSAPVHQAHLVFPDEQTSPTGLVIGSPLDDSTLPPIDLVAHTRADGPVRALAAVSATPEPVTADHGPGATWCGDATRLFGGPSRSGTWLGMPPTFVPVASAGVDGITWGFVWDRPDQPIDDGLVYRISPGGGFVLEEVRTTSGLLVAELAKLRDGTGGTDQFDMWAQALATTPDATARATAATAEGDLSRQRVVAVDDGEQRLALSNGDAIRVPADGVVAAGSFFSGSLVERIDLVRVQLADGFAGSAYRTASECLIAAAQAARALEVHASYAAMIEPLRALDRDLFADRCVAMITQAAPMCHDVRGLEQNQQGDRSRVAFEARGLIEPGSTLRFDVDGATVVVDIMSMRPLRLSEMPGGTVAELFGSGAVEPAPEGGFVSRHGKPVLGAVVDGRLVVGSVWEFPQGPGVSVEAVVAWSD